MAKNSPLSRWAGQPVLKHLRFKLNLDDPKLPKEQWLTLQGDRTQLEMLHEVVSTYVQHFLEQSYTSEPAYSFEPVQAYQGNVAVLPPDDAIAVLPTAVGTSTVPSNPNSLSLRPKGLLTHELTLGTLATPETANTVQLSALQLSDLANALDEYALEMVALPDLPRSRRLPSSLNWGQLAATGLVVVGLSASVAKIIDSSLKPASPTASQGGSSSDQQIATQPPPSIAESPLPSIALGQKLPPPPPLGSTVPGSPGMPLFPSPLSSANTPKTGKAPVRTVPKSNASASNESSQRADGRIAVVPQAGVPSGTDRSRSAQPMPNPLALQRELASVPPGQSPNAAAQSSAGDRSAQTEPTGTAFDTIPQVAEARQYFQQRWNPPQGLTQTLEYTLLVGSNGSLQRTVPLGQAAGDYVDRSGIPLVGEPFVSAVSSGRNAKIRLVLSPDGSVKTFLEGFY